MGKPKAGQGEAGRRMRFIRGAFRFPLVGSLLDKAKTKNWEVGSHGPSLDHSGPVAAEVVNGLPGLVAPKVVCSCFSGHILSGHCPFV